MELLICDDCSSDNTVPLIDKWLKKSGNAFERVVFIKHNKNHGVTESLNELISECGGDLISPLASDDYYLDGAIALRGKALSNNSNLLGAFSDGIAVGLNGENYSDSILKSSGINPDSLSAKKILNTIILHWCEPMNLQFWKRSAFKIHGGEFEFDGSVFCEDLDFATWALSKKAFVFLNHKCVAYRCRTWPQSNQEISQYSQRKKLLDMAYLYGKSAKLFTDNPKDLLEKKAEFYLALACQNSTMASKKELEIKILSFTTIRIVFSEVKKQFYLLMATIITKGENILKPLTNKK
jgi:glycosyltransferase involved in cell wall biosynthesis